MAKLWMNVGSIAGMCAVLAVVPAAMAAAPPEPGFWLMGYPAGGKASGVQALSQDGLVAGGWTTSPGFGGAAFSWTAQSGRNDWGIGAGLPPYSPVYAANSAGNAFAGWMTPGPGPNERAYRRVGNGPMENLGTLPGESRSFAWGLSGDGNVVVGHAEHGAQTNAFGQAFRWTPTKGMQGLGYAKSNGTYSVASGISRDGSTIVGKSQSFGPFGPVDAFVWTEATGMKALPKLPNPTLYDAEARAVNSDGLVTVGDSPSSFGKSHAVRWTPTGVEDLVSPQFANLHSTAFAVSDDGAVAGGSMGFLQAFIWSEQVGMLKAADYLALYGVNVPSNYTLEEVRAISGDGLTFGGYARNLATNQTEGFVATVPTPSLAAIFAVPLVAMACRRRRE